MKIEWKMMRKLLLLILVGQMIPELNAQDLNTVDETSKTEVVSQQNPENSDAIVDNQKEETVTEVLNVSVNQQNPDEKNIEKKAKKKRKKKKKSKNKSQIQEIKIEEKIVEQPQATTPVISGTIVKHGMEFSISKINPEEVLDVQKIVSPDELDSMKAQNEEYFNKKYLNKEVVIIGPFYSISRHSRNYKLKIDKFDNGPFTFATSCYFQKDQKENLKTFLQRLTLEHDYILVKGKLTSTINMDNCKIVGFAKTE